MYTLIQNENLKHYKGKQRGFTLIEIAISIVIIGLIVAPLFQIYETYQKREQIRLTDTRVQQSVTYLQAFRTSNGAYPCPARVNVAANDVGYGRAVDCQAPPYDSATIAPGTCSGDGICMEQAIAARVLADPNVIVGALPYRDLQLDEESSLDGYGNRLMYAVTYSMTDRTTIDDTMGAISVEDVAGNTRVVPAGSADYIIFSTGKTGQGAYSREGGLVQGCVDGSTLDAENCNIGFETGVAVSRDAIYVAGLRADAAGANFYDDVVEFASQERIEPWKRTEDDPENIESLAPEDMGIGVANPINKLAISSTVDPSLRVSGLDGANGVIRTDVVCDVDGNCFWPENIGGDNTANPADGTPGDGMKCPGGEYMVGIEGAAARCETNFEVRCTDPDRPVLVGFDADGDPECVAIPGASCPAEAQTLCPGHATTPDTPVLPASADGTNIGWRYAGDCRRQRYRCDAGTWVTRWSPAGHCNDSVESTDSHECVSAAGYGPGPLTEYTVTGETDCGVDEISTLLTDCTCIGDSDTESCASCPEGMVASGPIPTYDRARTCNPDNTLNGWSNVTSCPAISTYCSCPTSSGPSGPTYREQNVYDCGANRIRDPDDPRRQPQVWNTSTCSWDDSGPVIGSCICDPDPVSEVVPITCSACDETAVAGVNYYARDPGTCAQTGAPLASSVAPRCDPYPHFWRQQGSSTADVTLIPFDVNDPCSCSVFASTVSVNCKSPSNTAHTCNCLP